MTTTGPSQTVVYETFWQFAAERQSIFMKRVRGQSSPWTDDPILRSYRFTNPYRASDRVSQYLIRNVIYGASAHQAESTLFRVLLFKFFNRIETWELFEKSGISLSWPHFDKRHARQLLENEIRQGRPIYSSAYVMPPGQAGTRNARKHESHLEIIEHMMRDNLSGKLLSAKTMKEAYDTLRRYPLMGPFLAYQLLTDFNYGPFLSFSETEFVTPGPGARSGIRKCFSSLQGRQEAEIIYMAMERQEHEFKSRGLEFHSLWGRPLQLIDIQNLFCEVDKYARAKHSEIVGVGGRQRIKRRFMPSGPIPPQWYPPKWGINEAVSRTLN